MTSYQRIQRIIDDIHFGGLRIEIREIFKVIDDEYREKVRCSRKGLELAKDALEGNRDKANTLISIGICLGVLDRGRDDYGDSFSSITLLLDRHIYVSLNSTSPS